MATLSTRLTELATRIGTELKSVRTLVNGNAANLSGLTTTSVHSNLVSAINALQAEITTAAAGGLTPEQVEDIVGAMTAGNTESGITVTYDDPTGKLNFTVDNSPLLNSQNGAYYRNTDNHTSGTTNKVFTAAEQTKLTNLSGTNTGDQTAATVTNSPSGNLTATTVQGALNEIQTDVDGVQTSVAGKVDKATFDANTILAANVDDTPVALPVAVSTIVGRKATGNIGALTPAEARTVLDFDEAAQDAVAVAIAAGAHTSGVTITYNDAANSLSFSVAVTPGQIVGFDTQVRTSRLDQFQPPTASVSFNSQLITGVLNPVSGTDAANKNYVDGVAATGNNKGAVRTATTGNISLAGVQTVDGVTLVATDLVLVKDQTVPSENGLYVVASGAWARTTNADTTAEVKPGLFVFVSEGSTQGDQGYTLTTNDPVTLGTTALVFTQTSGAGQILAGTGIQKTGNTISVSSAVSLSADIGTPNTNFITFFESALV